MPARARGLKANKKTSTKNKEGVSSKLKNYLDQQPGTQETTPTTTGQGQATVSGRIGEYLSGSENGASTSQNSDQEESKGSTDAVKDAPADSKATTGGSDDTKTTDA